MNFKNKGAEARAGTHEVKPDVHQGTQDGIWMYHCVSCVAPKNIPVGVARKEIRKQHTKHDFQRCKCQLLAAVRHQ